MAPGGSKRPKHTADLFPITGCCIRRPLDIDRGSVRAVRPLNDRHKKTNTDGVGSHPVLEVSTPRDED